MRSKKADRWIVLSLIAALAVETVLLLWHLGVISWNSPKVANQQGPAGIVARNENELRRRSINSLVWEKSHADESVFFYDSLLTLAQSTAVVKLAQDAEVELAENTLVTIEPAEKSLNGEIRLKFVRGNLQARNPWTNTRIDAPDFVVDIKAGSEMQLRQTGDNEFEVQMKKGEATVTGAGGSVAVNPQQLVRLNQGRSETLEVDADLKWVSPPPARVYSHTGSNETHLRWDGEARELRLQKTGEGERVIALQPGQREFRTAMDLGDHLVYLRNEGRTSAPLKLQLWRAPLLHLITPLPRNRVRTHETTFFLWTRVPEAASYVFKLKSEKGETEEEREGNSHQMSFSSEDDAEWSVWGKDAEGFLIPPLYQYPLFIRDMPFAPPTLNAPRLRKPAQSTDKGAFLWLRNLLLPVAHAEGEDRFEATFSWQAVPGADQYLIEISETADFRHPQVSARTGKTEFVWREFRDRVYYWRVAAGNRAGRMGVFSEPAQVSPGEGVELKKIESAEVARKSPAPEKPLVSEKPEKPADSQKPAEPPKTEEAQASPAPADSYGEIDLRPRVQEPRALRVLWTGGYGIVRAKADQNVSAALSGPKALSVAIERDFMVSRAAWWTAEGKYSRATFKPEPPDEYPFQQDLVLQNIEARFSRMKAASPWGFGFSAALLPKIERENFEAIRAASTFAGGVHARGNWQLGRAEYQGDFGLSAGGSGYGFSTSHRLLWHQRRLLMGFGAQATYLLQGSSNTLSADGFLSLGFEF